MTFSSHLMSKLTLGFKVTVAIRFYKCNAIMYDSELLHVQTPIPRLPSGSESRAAIGIGEGTVDAGRETTEIKLNVILD